MENQLAELAERSKALSPDDRSRLVDMILESLDQTTLAEVDAAWDAEAECRLAAYDRGEIRAIDGELVLAKAHALATRDVSLPCAC